MKAAVAVLALMIGWLLVGGVAAAQPWQVPTGKPSAPQSPIAPMPKAPTAPVGPIQLPTAPANSTAPTPSDDPLAPFFAGSASGSAAPVATTAASEGATTEIGRAH